MRLHRFDLLRFPLIVLVVYVHAAVTSVNFADSTTEATSPFDVAVEDLFSHIVAGSAVPLFFLISAFLFFRTFQPTLASYLGKLKSRVGTLLVPFVFWNVALLMLYAIGPNIPATASLFSHLLPRDGGVLTYLDVIVGVHDMPIAFQFWFIRDLIVMVLLSPLVWAVLRLTHGWVLVPLLVCWLLDWTLPYPPAIEAVAYFALGAHLAIAKQDPFGLDRFMLPVTALYAVLVVFAVVMRETAYGDMVRHLAAGIGVAVALGLSGWALNGPRLSALLLALAPASFFVFATHEPLQSMLRKLLYRALPMSPEMALAIYALLPVVVIAITLALYFVLRRLVPRLLALVSGGR